MTNYQSGRVRLARNLKTIPFPSRMNADMAREVIDKVWDALSSCALKDTLKIIKSEDCDKTLLASLSEKHLISPDFLKGTLPRGVIISEDETISIMINEEDHIRIQVFAQGSSLDDAYDTADKIDNLLSEKLDIAFSEKFGYLTACPTNAGTGMRASFMLHLPALTMSNSISSVLTWANKLGLAVRGIYGEGSKAKGAFYQLSNQITLGATEKDIIQRVNLAAEELMKKEEMVRNTLFENNRIRLTDKCMRSYGILSNAYALSSEEAFSLTSDVLLGISLGIINNITTQKLSDTLFLTLPSSLAQSGKLTDSDPVTRDVLRAQYFRENLNMGKRKDD
ncbi:MAG: protein arginine kinase [Clostridia bacterium]|nr:protein arginine kinase [Clostridia bacterium]